MSRRKRVVDEHHVKTRVVQPHLDRLEAWHFMPVQTGYGESGIPDHLACVPTVVTPDMVGKIIGRFVAVESKRPGRRGEPDRGCTPKQRDNLVGIVKAGGIAIVCDSEEDLERLKL